MVLAKTTHTHTHTHTLISTVLLIRLLSNNISIDSGFQFQNKFPFFLSNVFIKFLVAV